MKKLTRREVEHIAKLANLKLKGEEIERFRKQLTVILEYIEKLKKVKTKDVEPTSQLTGLKNIFREDRVDKGRYTGKGDFYKIKAIF